MEREYIIENLSANEIDKLYGSNIEWCLVDFGKSDVYIYGTLADIHKAFKIIGRE